MEVIVRGKSIQTFPDLLAAGQFYLEEHCRQWLEHQATCVLPPIPWTVYNRVLGPNLSDDGRKKDGEIGDDAELMVYKNVTKCGERNGEPLFLIAQLDYDPDNKTKQTPALLKSFLSDKRQRDQLSSVTEKMDVDLIIVHQEIGAIIMETKSAADPLNKIAHALNSLCKAENLLRVFCSESFPLYKVIVFPNCESLSQHQKKTIHKLEGENGFVFCDKAFATNPDAVSKLLVRFKSTTLEKGYPNLKEETDVLLW